MKRRKLPTDSSPDPVYPNIEEALIHRRRFMALVAGGAAAAAVLGCKDECDRPSPHGDDRRLAGKQTRPLHPDAGHHPVVPKEVPVVEVVPDAAPPPPEMVQASLPDPVMGDHKQNLADKKIRSQSARLSDGTSVSYALLLEISHTDAPALLGQKSEELLSPANKHLRNNCDYHSVSNKTGKRRIVKRLNAKMKAATGDTPFEIKKIKFFRIQENIRKKGSQPSFSKGSLDL